MLDELRDALTTGNAAGVSGIAHRLRGSPANFVAEQAAEAAFRLVATAHGKSITYKHIDRTLDGFS